MDFILLSDGLGVVAMHRVLRGIRAALQNGKIVGERLDDAGRCALGPGIANQFGGIVCDRLPQPAACLLTAACGADRA